MSTCADNLHKIKGLWNPAYLVLNFWPSAKAFQDVCSSGLYTSYSLVIHDINYLRHEGFVFTCVSVCLIVCLYVCVSYYKFIKTTDYYTAR